ncbi:uncharacterized protein LOC106660827 [Cimex lectularius]|uniref:FHA domain-containing protein n=1 Tax=Cimex lectularius TaxID=79782 RepID=A0A8I6SDN9_CIMLE|nr:uncharacterized protein LOC106660827 [Cimex lectularius]XP_024081713.1 uncharacterized protein LOC106660827 [Cimex lectularius]
MMKGKLVLKDSSVPFSYIVQSMHTYIGHDINCNVRLYGANVSPQHCVIITLNGEPPIIRNMSQTNTTLLNNVNISSEDYTLKNNDLITIGNVQLLWTTGQKKMKRKRRAKLVDGPKKRLMKEFLNPTKKRKIIAERLSETGLLCRVFSNSKVNFRKSLRSFDFDKSFMGMASPVLANAQTKHGKMCFSHSTPAPDKCKLDKNSKFGEKRTPFLFRKKKMLKMELSTIDGSFTSNPSEKTSAFNFSFSPSESKSSVKNLKDSPSLSKTYGRLQKSHNDTVVDNIELTKDQCNFKNNSELNFSNKSILKTPSLTTKNENRSLTSLRSNVTPSRQTKQLSFLSLNSTKKKALARTSMNISLKEDSFTPSRRKSILKNTTLSDLSVKSLPGRSELGSLKNEDIPCTPKTVERTKEINFRSPRNSSLRLESDCSPSSTPKKPCYFKKLAFSVPRQKMAAKKNLSKNIDALCLEKSVKAAKQLKSEPPKALDKKKVAALLVCHRKKSPAKRPDVQNELSTPEEQQLPILNKSRISASESPLSANVKTSVDYVSLRREQKDELLNALDLKRKSEFSPKLNKPSCTRRLRSSSRSSKIGTNGESGDCNSLRPVANLLELADKKIEGIFNTSSQVNTSVKKLLPLPTVSHMDRVYTTSTVVDYTDVSGVKKLFTPSPKGDYRNPMGIKELFATEKSSYLNIQGVRELFSDDNLSSNNISSKSDCGANNNKTSVVIPVKSSKRLGSPINNNDCYGSKRIKIDNTSPSKKNPFVSLKKVTFEINETYKVRAGKTPTKIKMNNKQKVMSKDKKSNNEAKSKRNKTSSDILTTLKKDKVKSGVGSTRAKISTQRKSKTIKSILNARTLQNDSDINRSLNESNSTKHLTKESNEKVTTNNERENKRKSVKNSKSLTKTKIKNSSTSTSLNQSETVKQKKRHSLNCPKTVLPKQRKTVKKTVARESHANTSKVANVASNKMIKNSKVQTPVKNKKATECSNPKSLKRTYSPKTTNYKKEKSSENLKKKTKSQEVSRSKAESLKTPTNKARSKNKKNNESTAKIESSQLQSPNVSVKTSKNVKKPTQIKRSSPTTVERIKLPKSSNSTKNSKSSAEGKTKNSNDSARIKNKKSTVEDKTRNSKQAKKLKIEKSKTIATRGRKKSSTPASQLAPPSKLNTKPQPKQTKTNSTKSATKSVKKTPKDIKASPSSSKKPATVSLSPRRTRSKSKI